MTLETHTPHAALTPRAERAIAARDAIEGGSKALALVPKTFLEAQAFSGALAESDLIPDKLRKRAPDVLVILLAGIELGLAPMQSIRLYHVIEGIPRLSADGITAIVMASPLCEYLECTESNESRATWVTKKRGRPERSVTWTIERAKRAGLTEKKNRDGSPGMWIKYPENMLSSRAKAELCRIVYPEIAAGLVSREEAWDGAIDAEFTEVRVPFAAPPPPAANTNGALVDPPAEPPPAKRGPGRPPKDRQPIETVATEVPAAKLDAAIAKVEQKTAPPAPAPTPEADAASTAPVPAAAPPADDDDATFGPERVAPPATDTAREIAEFYAWLASCKNQRELKAGKGAWLAWSMEHLGVDPDPKVAEANAAAARAMGEAYAKRNAEVPA